MLHGVNSRMLVFLVRLLVLTVPLFLLAALVGLVNGLVRRDARSFGSGVGFFLSPGQGELIPSYRMGTLG